jgi:hypothetical protein
MFHSKIKITIAATIGTFISCAFTYADSMTFFGSDQVALLVAEGPTWDKISSNGYYAKES